MSSIEIIDNEYLIFKCPHCDEIIQVYINELNCCIFRHATLCCNLEQVNPHLAKQHCDSLVDTKQVYGCCKPFRIIKLVDNSYIVEKCDYI